MTKKRHFIIRMDAGKSSRKLRTSSGHKSYAANIARRLKLPCDLKDLHPKFRGRFGWTQVRFPDHDQVLTLVIFWDRQKEPVVLLTDLNVREIADALRIIEDYLNRWWGCEDPIRFIKDQIRLEKFLIDGIHAIRHWFFWITVAFSLLFEVLKVREILRPVLKLAQPFRKKVRFPYYRILRGLSTLLRNFPPLFKRFAWSP
ncbi:MAG: hypothetical protein HYS08_07680 [Chlamydiae bacterium]|nr:hypothetical protein [Chlamydiota bacterium]